MNKTTTVFYIALLVSLSGFGQSFTMDYTTHGSTTFTSPTLVPATNQSVFAYYGFPVTNYVNSSNVVGTVGITGNHFQPVQVVFDFTGTNMELQVNNVTYPANSWDWCYWELTDGYTTSNYTNELMGNGPYNVQYVPVTFASGGVHHLRLSVRGNFGGINVTNGNSVSKTIVTTKPNLLMVLGDSFTEGYNPSQSFSGTASSYWLGGWVWQLAKLVPNTICLPSAVGGTGFASTNGVGTDYLSRLLTDFLPAYTNAVNSGLYNQIFVTASGTLNDRDKDTNIVAVNLTNAMTRIINGMPSAHIFMLGNWYGGGGESAPAANEYVLNIVMSNAAVRLGQTYYSPVVANLLNSATYNTFYPSGTSTDGVHPSTAGYAIMAQWLNANLGKTFGTNWDANSQQGGGTVYYTLTVNNGSGSGSYPAGQLISITASNIVGSYFTNWSGAMIASPNQQLTTVTMPAGNLVVTANLVKIPSSSSINVTNYGAIGDAVRFVVQTTSNSPMVSVIGANRFSSADIGKVIEIFRTGPWTYYSNNPAYGVFSTNQDTICLITNVTQGTNLWGSIPQGWTTNAYCIVGSNNRTNFQNCINAAQASVSATNPNVTINIPAGNYLIIGAKELNPDYIAQQINDSDAALTITSGGLTFIGESTNSVLMGCGAGMEHRLWNNYDPANTWPYGNSGAWVPIRGTMIQCLGTITNSQYPLVFQNLTLDGGLTNGLQAYDYWILNEGNGDGWDTTHHAVLDINPNGTPGDPASQMHQLKVFTNCVFQHWRGEMLICTTGVGGTNTFNDIANCTFFDGNASANNLYFGQHVHGCTFSQLVKVQEYYQGNATLPTVFENNLWTNIQSNPFSIVGATTNANPPTFILRNNVMAGMANVNQITFSPAENVTVVSNTFYGPSGGVVFSSAGLQPSDGSASIVSNIVIACNMFNDTAVPILMDGIPVTTVLVTNNTSQAGAFATAGAGWKTNIVFANNAAAGWLDSRGVQAGSYFIDQSNNSFGTFLFENGAYSVTNGIGYGTGRKHNLVWLTVNSVFYLDDSKPTLVPLGAQMNVLNSSSLGAKIYTTARMTGTPMILPSGQNINYYWVNGIWQTNLVSIKLSPPSGMRVILQ